MSPAAHVHLAQYKRYRQIAISSMAQPAAAQNVSAAAFVRHSHLVPRLWRGRRRHWANVGSPFLKRQKYRESASPLFWWGEERRRHSERRHKDTSGELLTRLGRWCKRKKGRDARRCFASLSSRVKTGWGGWRCWQETGVGGIWGIRLSLCSIIPTRPPTPDPPWHILFPQGMISLARKRQTRSEWWNPFNRPFVSSHPPKHTRTLLDHLLTIWKMS